MMDGPGSSRDYNLRNRPVVMPARLRDEEVPALNSPLIQRTIPFTKSKTPSRAGSSVHSRSVVGSYSSETLAEEVDSELNGELLALEQQESTLKEAMSLIENEIQSHTEDVAEVQQRLTDGEGQLSPDEVQDFKQELKKAQLALKESLRKKRSQEIIQNSRLEFISKTRAHLQERATLKKKMIVERNEQLLSSDEEDDTSQLNNQQQEEAMRLQTFITDSQKERMEREAQDMQRAVEQQRIEARQRGEEEKRRIQMDSDRRMAEAIQAQLKLEEEIKGRNSSSVVSVADELPMKSSEKTESSEVSAIQMLAKAIQSIIPQPVEHEGKSSKFLARQSYAKELPFFSGKPEEWPIFKADFERSTTDCGFSHSENMSRLRRCLKGDAAEYVQCMMVSPDNVPQIMKDLEERYGQPENIISAMILKARELPPFTQDDLESLIRFGSAVKNLSTTVLTLKRPEHLCNPELLQELERKLPPSVVMQWYRWLQDDSNRKNNLEYFSKWIAGEVTLACKVRPSPVVAEKVATKEEHSQNKNKKPKYEKTPEWRMESDVPSVAGLYAGEKNFSKCIFCSKHPDSMNCSRALDMTLAEKKKIISDVKCCHNCLGMGHFARDCKVFVKCFLCKKRHPTLMCPDLPSNKEEKETSKDKEAPQKVNALLAGSGNLILSTVNVTIFGKHRNVKTRLLMDNGSHRSYILKSLAEELDLSPVRQEQMVHNVFTGMTTPVTTHNVYEVVIKNKGNRGSTKFRVRDQGRICQPIPRMAKGPWMKELRDLNIYVNDIGEGSPEIGILIGADGFRNLITGKQYWLHNGLLALETTFGWTVIGETGSSDPSKLFSTALSVTSSLFSDSTIELLWNLDTLGIRDPAESKSKAETEQLTKDHFLETVTRTQEGRYSVALPWVIEKDELPSNKKIAEARLVSATKKIVNLGYYNDYNKIFQGWEEEGIIEEVPVGESNDLCHYLPHRAVIKPENLTTPLRPVFDASCKGPRTPSLNDSLEKGPNLLELIPSIVTKFRVRNIGVCSDIRKAFQMVEVREEDRNFLRFLWWENESQEKMVEFRHNRVVFGVNCSPFLLAAVLEDLLKNVAEEHKCMASKVLKSLYVDNLVLSVDTFLEAEELKSFSVDIMNEAKMELRCWERGFSEKSGVDLPIRGECGLDFGRPELLQPAKVVTSLLGYKWNKLEDCLYCDVNIRDKISTVVSKRVILSCAQRVFDPIGFTCPASLQPKMILQKLWASKIKWDEEIDTEEREEFLKWYVQMDIFKDIKIPRNISGWTPDKDKWQVHTFCDASKDAYAAVTFLRVETGQGVSVQLIMAKARVAPLKKMTINRLELLASFIGARLTASIRSDLSLESVPTYYWSDSSTVLAWIRRQDNWGTFVGNRVKAIAEVSDVEKWRHVPGVLNPADLPSRGCSPRQLLESKWWEGPTWLKSPEINWPSEDIAPDEDAVISERRKTVKNVTGLLISMESPWYLSRSVFTKNVLIVAWMLRWFRRGKENSSSRHNLSPEEVDVAETVILKMVQHEVFPKQENVISGIKVLKNELGLICVKTKLFNRRDTEFFRTPVLLPHLHPAVDQIIREAHLRNNHAGAQVLMGLIREKYWIIRGRRAITRIIRQCLRCRRYDEKRSEVVPAPLPENRVKTSKVFEIIGVDLAGPLFLKRTKEGIQEKVWIVLYTCSVYRCIHLELVKAISTDAFLDAFSRFVSRRGRPSVIYSDNGTNFVGANNALRQLDWLKITRDHGIQKIQWIFNPPAAPWWGGFWERLVRSVKILLKKTLGNSKLTFDKMGTCLCEIEATINARPLTVVTEDPDDLIPLTPAMFLHEIKYPMVTDQELLEASGFQRLLEHKNKFVTEIKMRFRNEYLALLVHRGKEKVIREFQIGDVVFIGSDDKKRWQWPLARIIELYPGKDGNIRVAKLKTSGGFLTRPIQWLFATEISAPIDSPRIETTKEVVEVSDGEDSPQDRQEPVVTRFGRVVKTPKKFSE